MLVLGKVYLGIWIFADDIVLLSPSRAGLQYMTDICETFASSMRLKFSTNPNIDKSKTKCIIFTKDRIYDNDVCPDVTLNGMPLPYVQEIKHLGNILQCDNSMKKDCNIKRAKFISKVHSISQEFHFANPVNVVKLYKIYACDFYGSQLWDLYSYDVEKLYNSWNVAMRILFDVPRSTHRYLIEPISGTVHIKTIIASNFISFYNRLNQSKKLCIRLLTNLCKNDFNSILCSNLHSIAEDCDTNVGHLTKNLVKNNMTISQISNEQKWRIPILNELLDRRFNETYIAGFSDIELTEFINFLCTN